MACVLRQQLSDAASHALWQMRVSIKLTRAYAVIQTPHAIHSVYQKGILHELKGICRSHLRWTGVFYRHLTDYGELLDAIQDDEKDRKQDFGNILFNLAWASNTAQRDGGDIKTGHRDALRLALQTGPRLARAT